MRSAIANRAISVTVLVVAVAAAAGLAVWKHTVTLAASAPQPTPRAEPVNTVLRACPAPGLTGAPAAQVALVTGPASTGSGRAVVTRLGAASDGTPLVSLTQPGALSVTGIRLVGTQRLLGQKVRVLVPAGEGQPPTEFLVRILWTCPLGDDLIENGGQFVSVASKE